MILSGSLCKTQMFACNIPTANGLEQFKLTSGKLKQCFTQCLNVLESFNMLITINTFVEEENK